MNELLMIFIRNAVKGKVKTRLAKSLGDQTALDIYRFLLAHTQKITKTLPTNKWVYYSEEIVANDNWNENNYAKKLQAGSDLGQRMLLAFKQGLASHEKVVIIGSDIYQLKTKHLKRAFEALDDHDAVVGPAKDGGYYLLGLRKLNEALFENKKWGTATVLTQTLNNLKDQKVCLLEELNDIDVVEDIKNEKAFDAFTKNTIL